MPRLAGEPSQVGADMAEDVARGGDATPAPPARKRIWVSVHIYSDQHLLDKLGDQIILALIERSPTCVAERDGETAYFFIRYADPHPHIRFRVKTSLPPEAVRSLLGESVQELSRIELHPYEPEWNRYGGVEGVRVAETWFQASSRFAAHNLKRVSGLDRVRRLAVATHAAALILRAFLPERLDALRYATSLSCAPLFPGERLFPTVGVPDNVARLSSVMGESVRFLWRAFPEPSLREGMQRTGSIRGGVCIAALRTTAEDKNVETPSAAFAEACRQLSLETAALAHTNGFVVQGGAPGPGFRWQVLLPSYLHMMANRMGLIRVEERYVLWALSSMLRANDE